MPDVQTTSPKVLAVVSDLHLRHVAPLFRAEKGAKWYAVMERYLDCLANATRNVTRAYPGDIFHKWNSPPELINFAMEMLPSGYAIPGQHDLPLHNYEDIKKSAYWTLVQAGKLMNLIPNSSRLTESKRVIIRLHGFPWGYEVKSSPSNFASSLKVLNVAIVHAYIWNDKKTKYQDAPKEQQTAIYAGRLKGYDAAFFGDNHLEFTKTFDGLTIRNCGGFMRQKSDERLLIPKVSFLHADGTVSTEVLCEDKDEWEEDAVKEIEKLADKEEVEGLIDLLNEAGTLSLDFREVVRRYIVKKVKSKAVQKIILESIPD